MCFHPQVVYFWEVHFECPGLDKSWPDSVVYFNAVCHPTGKNTSEHHMEVMKAIKHVLAYGM